MQEMNQHLAQRLKGLRSELGWSLDVAARETGVSKAMLGQIERGESSPTVATLWKIATGFRVSFSSFIEPTPAVAGETLYRTADDIRQQPAGEGVPVGVGVLREGDGVDLLHMGGGGGPGRGVHRLAGIGGDARQAVGRDHDNCPNDSVFVILTIERGCLNDNYRYCNLVKTISYKLARPLQ